MLANLVYPVYSFLFRKYILLIIVCEFFAFKTRGAEWREFRQDKRRQDDRNKQDIKSEEEREG